MLHLYTLAHFIISFVAMDVVVKEGSGINHATRCLHLLIHLFLPFSFIYCSCSFFFTSCSCLCSCSCAPASLLVIVYILWTLTDIGLLYEGGAWAWPLELLRSGQ